MPRRVQLRELGVWANGVRVGTWRLPSRGPMEFEYAATWFAAPETRPLSLSLPLTPERLPRRDAAVQTYFDNLLPDSDSIRRRLQDRYRTASREAFDLLAAIGRDCVGAVQILAAHDTPPPINKIEAIPLTEAAVAAELAGVTSTPPPAGDDHDLRISIAGAQEKTALLRHNGRWCRPVGSTPSTHIFKLPLGLVGNRRADMRTSVENEWLCARILDAFGLPIAPCEIAQFGASKALIVERFDRQLHSSHKFWLRLVQEDFCQATGTPYIRKYQSDGGPGILDIARILSRAVEAPRDLRTLFAAQVLFVLLAATDGHAKNFSLRILAGGQFQLTPLYDVLSAWPVIGKRANEVPPEKARMAMAFPGERPRYHLAAIQRRHLETLANKMGLGTDGPKLIDEIVDATPAVISRLEGELPKHFPAALGERIFGGLRKSAEALAKAP